MDTLRSLIVDDEEYSRENLRTLLQRHCPEICISAVAESAEEARIRIAEHQPQVVFLDIEMPDKSGFELLDNYRQRSFSVVFVTAYGNHALRAIKAAAVDYIVKPISIDELCSAVHKLQVIHSQGDSRQLRQHHAPEHHEVLRANLQRESGIEKIILPLLGGFRIVRSADIVFLEADSSYTRIHVQGGEEITTCITLKEYEEMLGAESFFRIHKSTLLNLHYVVEYRYNHNGGIAVLKHGKRLRVSARREKEFIGRIRAHTHTPRV